MYCSFSCAYDSSDQHASTCIPQVPRIIFNAPKCESVWENEFLANLQSQKEGALGIMGFVLPIMLWPCEVLQCFCKVYGQFWPLKSPSEITEVSRHCCFSAPFCQDKINQNNINAKTGNINGTSLCW